MPKSFNIYIPEFIKTYGFIAVLIFAGFYTAAQFIEPPPPSKLTLAVGAKGGAYYEFGLKYQEFLKQEHKLDVKLVETNGALDNLALLNEGSVDAGFIQTGIRSAKNALNVEALGAIYYEPLWVFLKPDLTINDLGELKGLSISIGKPGGGTFVVSRRVLEANNVTRDNTNFMRYETTDDLFNSLKAGQIDAAFMAGGYTSPKVQRFLSEKSFTLMHFKRAEAYAKNYPYLAHVVLPEGLVDLQHNIPGFDTHLISPSAVLAVNKDFHGALTSLLVQTSHDIHNVSGPFNDLHEFPNMTHVDFTFAEQATRYFEHGPSFLQRYVPFWVADMMDRLKVMLIPLLGLLFPLMKIAPPTYRWRIRSKIYKWYKDLKRIETLGIEGIDKKTANELIGELERIDSESKQTSVPLSYADALYDLRLHIKLVRSHIEELAQKKGSK